MRIVYKPEDDVLLITFNDRDSDGGHTVTPSIHVHTDKNDALVELEVLGASQVIDDLPTLIERYASPQSS